jgi:hypothetical protein
MFSKRPLDHARGTDSGGTISNIMATPEAERNLGEEGEGKSTHFGANAIICLYFPSISTPRLYGLANRENKQSYNLNGKQPQQNL